jgi:hypothetical protein
MPLCITGIFLELYDQVSIFIALLSIIIKKQSVFHLVMSDLHIGVFMLERTDTLPCFLPMAT